MAEYQVTVTYTIEVDDELAVRDAGFRLWRQKMGQAADSTSIERQEDVRNALMLLVGELGDYRPAIPGARVTGWKVDLAD